MNEIKIYLKTSGRIAELYKDFDLYEGCYRNSQMSVYVPKSLLYENEDGTFANLVKTGAILTAPNGKKLTTKSYYLDYVKTETVVGIAYAVYTIITPKEFCVYAGTQTVVVNVESIDNTDKDNQKVISVTTTQTANLIVLESAYLGQDEPIEPTELDKIKATLKEIEEQIPGMEEDITGLQSKVSDLSENKLDKVSGNTTYKQAYAKDTNGDQIMQNYSTENVTNAIVQRDETGNIKITPGRKGYMNDGATMRNIADVESEVAKKYDKTGGTIDGNVQITGDLNVDGTTTTNDTETLQVKDNFIVTNADGTPLNSLSGIVIRTNANTTYAIVYDPISDSVKLGEGTYTDGKFTFLEGEGEAVAVRDDSTAFTDKHVIVWDAAGDKFVDGGKDVSDLPTLAGNNDFTGENSFSDINFTGTLESKTDDHQFSVTYRENNGYMVLVKYGNQYATYTQGPGTIVNDNTNKTQVYYFYDHVRFNRNDQSSVYNFIFHGRTIENGIHNFYLPNKTGTYDLATTDDIPTDYATQTALANTQRQVDGLYTLLEQKNEIYVQTASDTYTTRETAGGENIADGVQTPVKKITGATVKTTNLIPYPYVQSERHENGIDFVVNSDGTITANGTATGTAQFYPLYQTPLSDIGLFVGQQYTLGALPYSSYSSNEVRIVIQFYNTSGGVVSSFVASANTSRTFNVPEGAVSCMIYFVVITGVTLSNYTFSPMLNAGSSALPYMPYFSGLKNAFFKEIVSTGRNLIPYPYYDGMSKTENGITFTVNTDGTITVNGTATDKAIYYIAGPYSVFCSKDGRISGCPSGGGSTTYALEASNEEEEYHSDIGSGALIPANFACRVIIVIRQGVTLNNLVFKPMLNYGSSALPYEPYTQSVLSLPEAVELTEYDTAYPETGEIQRQSKTLTFDGTENWAAQASGNFVEIYLYLGLQAYDDRYSLQCASNHFNNVPRDQLTNPGDLSANYTHLRILQDATVTLEAFKSQLATWAEEGDPLTVTYKTAEVQSTEQADFSADSYIAWKNGSETIEQGDTDNSIYGAENTVEQDYYLLTAPEEVTKE